MAKKAIVLLLLVILFAPILSSNNTMPALPTIPELPEITSIAQEAYSVNMSSTKPVIIHPGEYFSIELKDYARIDGGYIFGVFLNDDRLELRNYTVSVKGYGKIYRITIPGDVESGLYDLYLYGNVTVYIPRSVWVIKPGITRLRIAHLTDLHYGTGHPDKTIGNYKRFSGLLLANILGADAIINTGDEADGAGAHEYIDSISYRICFAYSLPYLLIPGNHDWPLKNFYKYNGANEWYRIIDGKYLVIGIDTGNGGLPSEESMKFIEHVLEEYKDIPVKIILMHHPVFFWQGELHASFESEILKDPNEDPESPVSYYWGANLTRTRWFLRLVEDYNVTIVLAGHIHRDQYVKYHSTRTNTTTLFITTTTLAHSRPNYNGFIILDVYSDGRVEFPYTFSAFSGFANVDKYSVYNSIPVDPSVRDEYFFGEVKQAPHAYYFMLENRLKDEGVPVTISDKIILALPWNGTFIDMEILSAKNNASIRIIDKLLVNNVLYVAIELNMPYGSEIEFVLNNMPDYFPPNIELALAVPKIPRTGYTNKLYLKIYDSEWGLRNVTGYMLIDNKIVAKGLEPTSPNTYAISVKVPESESTVTGVLHIEAWDYAGNMVEKNLTIIFYPKGVTPEIEEAELRFRIEIEGLSNIPPLAKIAIASDKMYKLLEITSREISIVVEKGVYNISLIPSKGVAIDLKTPFVFMEWRTDGSVSYKPSILLVVADNMTITLRVLVGKATTTPHSPTTTSMTQTTTPTPITTTPGPTTSTPYSPTTTTPTTTPSTTPVITTPSTTTTATPSSTPAPPTTDYLWIIPVIVIVLLVIAILFIRKR